jgi:hypothetical protein
MLLYIYWHVQRETKIKVPNHGCIGKKWFAARLSQHNSVHWKGCQKYWIGQSLLLASHARFKRFNHHWRWVSSSSCWDSGWWSRGLIYPFLFQEVKRKLIKTDSIGTWISFRIIHLCKEYISPILLACPWPVPPCRLLRPRLRAQKGRWRLRPVSPPMHLVQQMHPGTCMQSSPNWGILCPLR